MSLNYIRVRIILRKVGTRSKLARHKSKPKTNIPLANVEITKDSMQSLN